jgi:hypothetical protein
MLRNVVRIIRPISCVTRLSGSAPTVIRNGTDWHLLLAAVLSENGRHGPPEAIVGRVRCIMPPSGQSGAEEGSKVAMNCEKGTRWRAGATLAHRSSFSAIATSTQQTQASIVFGFGRHRAGKVFRI